MSDDRRTFELERLVAAGRERHGPPSPRQLLAARMIDPSAWSSHAEEQIEWCRANGLLNSPSHFGARHMRERRSALIKAHELLRALDRQAAGLPELRPLDAQALSKQLGDESWRMQMLDRRRHIPHEPAKAVFFMKQADGIAAPTARINDDGTIDLTWTERERTAEVHVDARGKMTLSFDGAREHAEELQFHGWRSAAAATLTAAVEWVHHDGPRPRGADGASDADAEAA